MSRGIDRSVTDTADVSLRAAFNPRPLKRSLTAFAYKYGILVAWGLVIGVFGFLRPDTFLSTANLTTSLGSQASLVMLSIGLLLPLTVGEYDLSCAGVLGLALILTEYLNVQDGWPLFAAILVALAAGVAVGIVNAFIIIRIGVDSIVATLGMGTFLIGVGYGLTPATLVGKTTALSAVAQYQLFGIQLSFYLALALTVLTWYVYRYTPLGRYLYFVGSGRNVARLSGIRVDAIRAGALVSCGFISALTGVVLAGTIGASSPGIAASYLLPAFAAIFLGATSISPGRFNPWGTFIAVYFLITGITGLELLGYVGWIEQVFYGGSLVLAVALSRLVAGKAQEV